MKPAKLFGSYSFFILFIGALISCSVKNKNIVFGSRGQITIEFIVTIIVVLFIFGFGLFIFEQRFFRSVFSATFFEWATSHP